MPEIAMIRTARASGLAWSGGDRRRRGCARHRQRPLVGSGGQGAALGAVPLREIQQATSGKRIGPFGDDTDPLRETPVEFLLHGTPRNITARSRVACGRGVKEGRPSRQLFAAGLSPWWRRI